MTLMPIPAIYTGFGVLLLLWSSPAIYKTAVESYIESKAHSRYEITKPFHEQNRGEWRGNFVIISDSLGIRTVDFYHENWAPIQITINGNDYSVPNPIRIRPAHENANPYHGSAGIAILLDKQAAMERLGVIQHLHDPERTGPYFQARLLLVDDDGIVTVDSLNSEIPCI
jgi:hypothetical protein